MVVALLLVGTAGAAAAHAVVTGSDPADGAVLDRPPSEVEIRFSEPVSPLGAQVLGPGGENVFASDSVEGGDGGLRLALPETLSQGSYIVSYRVTSMDGHPIAGSLVFSVGSLSGDAPERVGDANAAWRWVFALTRAALYLGTFGAAGGVAYTVLARPSGRSREIARRIIARSAAFGIGAAVAALALQGGLLLGGLPGVLLNPAAWRTGIGSVFGRTALCAVLGLALIWFGSRGRPVAASTRLLLGSGAILVVVSFALSGHVITAGPRWLMGVPLLLHVAVTALWVGSLLPLYRALETPVAEAGPLLGRFSRVALMAVPILVLAGVVMAVVQVRNPEALIATEYGRLFLIKLALALLLFGLAALNRFLLTPALVRGDDGAVGRLGRSILGEIGLVIAILFVTASLGTTPPPRALIAGGTDAREASRQEGLSAAPEERRLQLSGQGFEALVSLQPGQVGSNAATIALRDLEGQPLEVLEVTLSVSNPQKGVEALERPAAPQGNGRWQVDDLVIGTSGTWDVVIEVLVSDFERQAAEGSLDLP